MTLIGMGKVARFVILDEEMAGIDGEGVKRYLVFGVLGEAEWVEGEVFLSFRRFSSQEMSYMMMGLLPLARSHGP